MRRFLPVFCLLLPVFTALGEEALMPADPPEPGTLRWEYWTGAEITYSSPAIAADGTIYIESGWWRYSDNTITAVNPDGTLKWTNWCGDGSYTPAIAADGTIYSITDLRLYALNPADGEIIWSFGLGEFSLSYISIAADGTIYIGVGRPVFYPEDQHLYALRPDGSGKWRYATNGAVTPTLTVAEDGTIYFGTYRLDRHCLNALSPDRTLKWQYETSGPIRFPPAIAADGTIYFGSDALYALHPDGTLRWRYQTGGGIQSSPAIAADGTVYFGSDDYYFYALNPDGTLKWRYHAGYSIRNSPAIASNGTIYFASLDRNFHALNADGTLRWRYPAGAWSSPAIADDGTVYFASGRSLIALWGDSPLMESPWPKSRHDNSNTSRVGGGAGTNEEPDRLTCPTGAGPTIVRSTVRIADSGKETEHRAELLDVSGRRIAELQPGDNSIRHLAPGIYFIRQGTLVRKVVIQR